MGFLQGSATFQRFRIKNDPTGSFGEEHLDLLKKNQIKASTKNLYESPSIGFLAGAHLFDTQFDFEKNIIGEALHFAIRVDSCKIPGPIKRAWMQIELGGIMKDNPGGRPSKIQREEAKEAVEARCETESEKGNFKKMEVTPVLWDAATDTLFLGSTSEKASDVCLDMLNDTFGLEFSRITSGKLALEMADETNTTAAVYDATPSAFNDESNGNVVWWNGMKDNYDYLGNEFLMWLWWHWDINGDMVSLPDQSEVSGMFSRSLALDCPIGEHGKESFSSDSPVALPEAMLAIRMGKQPRKAGLTLVRDGEQYDFTIKAEAFPICSARIRQVGNDTDSRDSLDRVQSIRELTKTVDLLFQTFCNVRFGGKWNATLKKIQSWLQNENNSTRQRRVA